MKCEKHNEDYSIGGGRTTKYYYCNTCDIENSVWIKK